MHTPQAFAILVARFPKGLALIINEYFEPKSLHWKYIGQSGCIELLGRVSDYNIGLYGACKGGIISVARIFLVLGALPQRGIVAACRSGCLRLVKILVKAGATPCLRCVYKACKMAHYDVYYWLRSQMIIDESFRMTAMDAAITSGDCSFAEYVRRKERPNGVQFQNNALASVCRGGDPTLIRYVIDRYMMPITPDIASHGLISACRGGHIKAITMAMGVATIATASYDIALQVACESGHVDAARRMISLGAQVRPIYLSIACQRNHRDVARLLIAEGGPGFANKVNDVWATNCFFGNVECFRILLDAGYTPSDYSRSIEAALKDNYHEIARMLIDHRASSIASQYATIAATMIDMAKPITASASKPNRKQVRLAKRIEADAARLDALD